MKFVISKQELSKLINKIQNVVAAKSTIPILSNFLIEAKKNELIFTATDLTVGIRCFADAKILEEGATTLPARRFCQLVRELTSNHLEITTNTNEVSEIIADSSSFKLHGMSKNEYPALPEMSKAPRFSISQKELSELLFKTAFAVSHEDSRYVLTGVLMRIEKGRLIFVGTDGKRLAKIESSVRLDASFSGDYIIPLKAVEEILKIIDEEEEDLTICLMEDKVGVQTHNIWLISKLLSGEYPDFNRVIPQESSCQVSLHREELMTLLRQMLLFTQEGGHSVRFSFSPGILRLNGNSATIGEGNVSMPVNYQGKLLEIAFNPTYFLDILRHSRDETVTLSITDPYNPGIVTDSSQAVFVIMPMRLSV